MEHITNILNKVRAEGTSSLSTEEFVVLTDYQLDGGKVPKTDSSPLNDKYQLTLENNILYIDFFGEIVNKDIEDANEEMDRDDSFFKCNNLLINTLKCNFSKVTVPRLYHLAAADLETSKTQMGVKIGYIATESRNIETVGRYIQYYKASKTTSELKIFPTLLEAQEWFNA